MDENQQSIPPAKGASPFLFIAVILIIVLISGAFWFTNNQNKESAQTTQTQETVTTAPSEPLSETTGDAMSQVIAVEGGEFYFKPNEIRAKLGEKITITLSNAGKMRHDFVLDEFDVKTEQISGDNTATVEFTPDKKGTFEFYCSVGSHRAMGMKGALIVE